MPAACARNLGIECKLRKFTQARARNAAKDIQFIMEDPVGRETLARVDAQSDGADERLVEAGEKRGMPLRRTG